MKFSQKMGFHQVFPIGEEIDILAYEAYELDF